MSNSRAQASFYRVNHSPEDPYSALHPPPECAAVARELAEKILHEKPMGAQFNSAAIVSAIAQVIWRSRTRSARRSSSPTLRTRCRSGPPLSSSSTSPPSSSLSTPSALNTPSLSSTPASSSSTPVPMSPSMLDDDPYEFDAGADGGAMMPMLTPTSVPKPKPAKNAKGGASKLGRSLSLKPMPPYSACANGNGNTMGNGAALKLPTRAQQQRDAAAGLTLAQQAGLAQQGQGAGQLRTTKTPQQQSQSPLSARAAAEAAPRAGTGGGGRGGGVRLVRRAPRCGAVWVGCLGVVLRVV
ncbi:hypothetical protein FB451DRAFT_1555094 [Mycena latifolia]|nr:hypothetical protein FB451DRAFT_1555094 [Mycena latifolia]